VNLEIVQPIGDLVRRRARTFGDKLLYVTEGRAVTYAEYDRRTDSIASWLLSQGVGPGERVATYMTNSVELLLAYSGIAKAGAITVFVNEQLTPREIRYILQDSAAKVVVTDQAHLEAVRQVRPDLPSLALVVVAGETELGSREVPFAALEEASPAVLPEVDVDAPCWIGYTSGTTGSPKGALLTHRGVTWVSAACIAAYALGPEDRILCTLPLFHSYAVNLCYVQVFAAGMTEYILPRFSPTRALEAVERHRITVFPQVPTGFAYLLNTPHDAYDLASLRIAISAGATLPASVYERFLKEYGIAIYDGWGSTETSMDAISNRIGTTVVPGSCGLPFPGVAVRIVDRDGHDLPPGSWGELLIRGPNVMLEYINKPEQTQKALKDGWYHTGDVAYQDKNGYVFIVDRLNDIIICGGFNIAPKEIEEVLLMHPKVLEAAVVGVPDEVRGEVPKAYVVPKAGEELTADEILSHCRAHLAAYKLPREVAVVASIPRTSSGKIQRYQLRGSS